MNWVLFHIDFEEYFKTGKIYVALIDVIEISCNPHFEIEKIYRMTVSKFREIVLNLNDIENVKTCTLAKRILLTKILQLPDYKISKINIDPRKYPKPANTINKIFENIAYCHTILKYFKDILHGKIKISQKRIETFLNYLFFKKGLNFNENEIQKVIKNRNLLDKLEELISKC